MGVYADGSEDTSLSGTPAEAGVRVRLQNILISRVESEQLSTLRRFCSISAISKSICVILPRILIACQVVQRLSTLRYVFL